MQVRQRLHSNEYSSRKVEWVWANEILGSDSDGLPRRGFAHVSGGIITVIHSVSGSVLTGLDC